MSATPAQPSLRALHPQVRERLEKLERLERHTRRERRERWRLAATGQDADNDGESWMLSYLDLVTLMLVLLVILVALSRLPAGLVDMVAENTPQVLNRASPAAAQAASGGAGDGADAQAAADRVALAAPAAQESAAEPGRSGPPADASPSLLATADDMAAVDTAAVDTAAVGATTADTAARSDAATPAQVVALDSDVPARAIAAAVQTSPMAGSDAAAQPPAADADASPASPVHIAAPERPTPQTDESAHTVSMAGSLASGLPQAWTLPSLTELGGPGAAAAPAIASSAPVQPSAPAGPATAPLDLAQLGLEGLGEGIDVILNERTVSFRISNELLFPSGQADLSGGGSEVIGRLAGVLARHPYPVSVEGHTDVVPIQTARFPSNWELSTARATSVLRQLQQGGIASDRLRAIGYAHTRPIADNGTAQGRATNRRVELIMEIPPGQAQGVSAVLR